MVTILYAIPAFAPFPGRHADESGDPHLLWNFAEQLRPATGYGGHGASGTGLSMSSRKLLTGLKMPDRKEQHHEETGKKYPFNHQPPGCGGCRGGDDRAHGVFGLELAPGG